MDLDRLMTRVNPVVVGLLRSPLHRLLGAGLCLITVTGRRSGQSYTIPVGYQRDGERFWILVSKARRKNWWRNFLDPAPAELRLSGAQVPGMAWVVEPESFEFRKAFERTFLRLPWLGRTFGLVYDRRTGLRDDQILHLAREAVLVQFEPSKTRSS